MRNHYSLLLFFLLATTSLVAQFDFPPLSSPGHISQQVGYTQVDIAYERPSVRDRKIFGSLVPWNKRWRTGAGYTTTISFDRAVQLGGQAITAGKYALVTIPTPDTWTVILHTDTTLFTHPRYDTKQEIIRFEVPAEKAGRFHETFTITVDLIPNNARIYLNWAETQISFLLETDANRLVNEYIDGPLKDSKDPEKFSWAASYFYYQNVRLDDGIELARRAIELDPSSSWARRNIIDICERTGNTKLAKKTVREAVDYYEKHPFSDPALQEEVLSFWKGLLEE